MENPGDNLFGAHESAVFLAELIEQAQALGTDRWGLSKVDDGIRFNVGWTEILTTFGNVLRVIAVPADIETLCGRLPDSVEVLQGESGSLYKSIPGSLLCIVPYEPHRLVRRAISLLRPGVLEAMQVAGRRRASRTVRAGHDQALVDRLSAIVGRPLPSPEVEVSASDGSAVMEGALRRVTSSEYERNPLARAACIAAHGTDCAVCGFSFEKVYGPTGAGFIHVHHLTPLSEAGKRHEVDPVRDLTPICPNCHSMLHRQDPPLHPDALRSLIRRPAR